MRIKTRIFVAALVAAICSVSCGRVEPDHDGYGFLSLSLDIDTDIEDLTRATTVDQADYSAYNVALYRGETQLWKTTYDRFVSDVAFNRIPAGEYVIEVESCTAEDADNGAGKMRMYGSESVTVEAGKTSDASVSCTMANARVTLAMSPEFASAIVEGSIGASVTDGVRKIAISGIDQQHLLERAVYFNVDLPSGKTVTFTVTAGIAENQKLKTFELPVTLKPGVWNKVTLNQKN